jgi:integrase
MGVIKRGNKLSIRFQDATKAWRTVGLGLDDTPENRVAAASLLTDAQREAGHAQPSQPSIPTILRAETVREYAIDTWIPERRALDLDWKNDRSRLETHVLPVIGDLPIASVRTRNIVDLFRHIRTTKLEATGDVPSQRTVYNIYSVVSALFRDAKLADKIEQTPCILDERQLGPLKDKNPEWRASAVFTRDEVQTLISSPVIPPDRQLVYALELLAGVRTGEAAALRWRHYDPAKKPLGELLVALSYNTRKNRAKGTKTDAVKHIPVHPTLAAMLAEWKLSGWAAMFGRAPEPDDLIVPLPPEAAARRRSREGDPFRGHDYSGKRWREEDLPALGEAAGAQWRHRRHYDMRATFITLALEDGADRDVIESRVTHTKKSRSAFDGYNRGEQWARTCAEVAKLKISRQLGAEAAVISATAGIENGIGRHSAVTAAANDRDTKGNLWRRRESNPRPKMRPNERLRV